jgi:hypothetical protein
VAHLFNWLFESIVKTQQGAYQVHWVRESPCSFERGKVRGTMAAARRKKRMVHMSTYMNNSQWRLGAVPGRDEIGDRDIVSDLGPKGWFFEGALDGGPLFDAPEPQAKSSRRLSASSTKSGIMGWFFGGGGSESSAGEGDEGGDDTGGDEAAASASPTVHPLAAATGGEAESRRTVSEGSSGGIEVASMEKRSVRDVRQRPALRVVAPRTEDVEGEEEILRAIDAEREGGSGDVGDHSADAGRDPVAQQRNVTRRPPGPPPKRPVPALALSPAPAKTAGIVPRKSAVDAAQRSRVSTRGRLRSITSRVGQGSRNPLRRFSLVGANLLGLGTQGLSTGRTRLRNFSMKNIKKGMLQGRCQ